MASKGKASARAPSTRARGSSSHQQPPLEIQLYETPEHAERAKILEDRKVIHEHTIKFPEGTDTFKERILVQFIMGPGVLNVPKFKGRCGYSDISRAYNKNELDMDEVLRVIGKEGATSYQPGPNRRF
ncbi:hypothetical protein PIB30_061046 [Stylosanthes scabra]|uniref:Uncharacterized protein n=1 Tax=Stylosanthes scabra TaxID=79078 RepID=A0ABU6SKQ8_9FABA|nr:hypothetical protein [Stylosanthes scabra]